MRTLLGVLALLFCVIGFDILVMTSSEGSLTFRLWPFSGAMQVAPRTAIFVGVFLGASLILAISNLVPRTQQAPPTPPMASPPPGS